MVAVPLTALVVMPAGLPSLALMPLGAEAVALVPMGWGVDAVLWVGRVRSRPGRPPRSWCRTCRPGGSRVLACGLAWAGLWRTRIRFAGWLPVALGLASPMLRRPPDLLLSADGRMVGLRDARTACMSPPTAAPPASPSTRWQVLWRARLVQPLGCGDAPCPLQARPGGPVALLVSGNPPDSACVAAVVVSLEPVRLPCPVPVVDRFSVWREGAYAIWLTAEGARVLSDRQVRGERIWMPRPTPRSRLPPGLTMAPAEELPPVQ